MSVAASCFLTTVHFFPLLHQKVYGVCTWRSILDIFSYTLTCIITIFILFHFCLYYIYHRVQYVARLSFIEKPQTIFFFTLSILKSMISLYFTSCCKKKPNTRHEHVRSIMHYTSIYVEADDKMWNVNYSQSMASSACSLISTPITTTLSCVSAIFQIEIMTVSQKLETQAPLYVFYKVPCLCQPI